MKGKEILMAMFLAVGVAGLVSSTYAQTPNTGNSPAATSVFDGKLSKVDADKKVITVTGTDEAGKLKVMSFIYTDATEIVGADRTAQSLTGKQGETVKVTYRTDSGDHIATKIEVAENRASR